MAMTKEKGKGIGATWTKIFFEKKWPKVNHILNKNLKFLHSEFYNV